MIVVLSPWRGYRTPTPRDPSSTSHSPPAHPLDGDYVVFGKVTQGMEVVDALAVGDKIVSATVTED